MGQIPTSTVTGDAVWAWSLTLIFQPLPTLRRIPGKLYCARPSCANASTAFISTSTLSATEVSAGLSPNRKPPFALF